MQQIDLKRFSALLFESVRNGGMSFAFLLGAGCSVSSRIPSASTLALRWIREMKRDATGSSLDFEEWYKSIHPEFSARDAGNHYAQVISKIYPDLALRRMAVQEFVSGRDPAIGYYALSALVCDETFGANFNVIFTTNFDDLAADSIMLFQHKKALIIPHEDLALHASSNKRRPLIVKLHGDANISPLNTPKELETLSTEMKDALARKLDDRGLIFIGYSGYDKTVASALAQLPASAIPSSIYWVNERPPGNDELHSWLRDRRAIWVNNRNFDQAMLQIFHQFQLKRSSVRRFKTIVEDIEDSFNRYDLAQKNVAPASNQLEKELKNLLPVFRSAPTDKIRDIIDATLANHSKNAGVLAACAQFAKRHRLVEFAKNLYEKALQADPEHPIALCAYAGFLREYASQLGLLDQTETADRLLRRACASNPMNPMCLGVMASFLSDAGRTSEAADFYERALQADGMDAETLSSYANFLWRKFDRSDEAIEYYQRSMDINSGKFRTLANFSQLLFLKSDNRTAHKYASSVVSQSDNAVLKLECLFYMLCHHPRSDHENYIREIRILLDRGVRSPGWDLSPNVEWAAARNHPLAALIRQLSDVISKGADIGLLQGFSAWQHGAK